MKGTCIKVFYPIDGVSPIQKQQMITQTGDNVDVIGIRAVSYTHLDVYKRQDVLYHRLKEIMVDEYQDTNQIQESLLLKISEYQQPAIPLFMVGDMKQSIYRFRQMCIRDREWVVQVLI